MALLMLIDVVIRFSYFRTESDPFFFILTFYLIGFAALLIASELGLSSVLVYVEFLNGRAGKGFYILFVGLLVFDISRISDMAISLILIIAGIFSVVTSCLRDARNKQYINYFE